MSDFIMFLVFLISFGLVIWNVRLRHWVHFYESEIDGFAVSLSNAIRAIEALKRDGIISTRVAKKYGI